jgi:hypothetical protein
VGPLRAGDDEVPAPAPAAPAVPAIASAEDRALVEVLRAVRWKPPPPADRIAKEMGRAVPAAKPLAFTILADQLVPALEENGAPQCLSEAQAELMLTALAREKRTKLVEETNAFLAQRSDAAARAAAIQILGAIGGSSELVKLTEVAAAPGETELDLRRQRALEAATQKIVKRDARALVELDGIARRAARATLPAILMGAGATRDPAIAGFLSTILRNQPALAQAALASIPTFERPPDDAAWNELESVTRGYLTHSNLRARGLALSALARLECEEIAEDCLAALDVKESGLADAGYRAIETLAGRKLPRDAESCRRWLAEERQWQRQHLAQALDGLASENEKRVIAALREVEGHPLFRRAIAVELANLRCDLTPTLAATLCTTVERLAPWRGPEMVRAMLDEADPAIKRAMRLAGRPGGAVPPSDEEELD